jgi:2-oxoglutarate ferredoxin oxidoreductase subunit beta
MDKVQVYKQPRLYIYTAWAGMKCTGCHLPIIERLIAEVIDELGIEGRTIGIMGVGCHGATFAMIDVDFMPVAHGPSAAVATGIKRVLPDAVVITMQGDGDCAAIGAGHFLNAVHRAEKITVIMTNNAVFGTTGGQMAPTTLIGQVTLTTPTGRDPSIGYPAHIAELIAPVKGVAYSARGAVNSAANYQRTKKYLRSAIEKQLNKVGFGFLEILSACPTDWHMSPLESLKWMEEKMIPEFPVGEFKNVDRVE